jgi:hypothetical protein
MADAADKLIGRRVRQFNDNWHTPDSIQVEFTGTVIGFDGVDFEVIFDDCFLSHRFCFLELVQLLSQEVANIRDPRFSQILLSGKLEHLAVHSMLGEE